jgi:hypothetical protein
MRYSGAAMALALAAALGLQTAGWSAAGRGLLLGGLASALNFVLLGEALRRRMAPAPAPTGQALMWRGLRCLVLAGPLVAAAGQPVFEILSTTAGLLLVPLCILLDRGLKPEELRRRPGPP